MLYVNHLGPLPSIKKSYKHIFMIVDAFSKFVWLYTTIYKHAGDIDALDEAGSLSSTTTHCFWQGYRFFIKQI